MVREYVARTGYFIKDYPNDVSMAYVNDKNSFIDNGELCYIIKLTWLQRLLYGRRLKRFNRQHKTKMTFM